MKCADCSCDGACENPNSRYFRTFCPYYAFEEWECVFGECFCLNTVREDSLGERV